MRPHPSIGASSQTVSFVGFFFPTTSVCAFRFTIRLFIIQLIILTKDKEYKPVPVNLNAGHTVCVSMLGVAADISC